MANPNLVAPQGFSLFEEDLNQARRVRVRYLDAEGSLREVDDWCAVMIRYRAEIVIWEPDGYCNCQDSQTVVPVEKLVTVGVELLQNADDPIISKLWVRGPNGELIATA